jgi:hypothetical protein
VFPCARTDASAIKSKRSRQLTIDFAKYDVKRPEYCRDIGKHMSASARIAKIPNVIDKLRRRGGHESINLA